MKWHIKYYNEKVQKKINQWSVGVRAFYARITERICQFGPNLGMPFTRSMGDGLFEIRAKGNEGIGRAFFCTVVDQNVIILHAFIKKSTKTPKKELQIAQKRLLRSFGYNTPPLAASCHPGLDPGSRKMLI
jgi:phage-related protein